MHVYFNLFLSLCLSVYLYSPSFLPPLSLFSAPHHEENNAENEYFFSIPPDCTVLIQSFSLNEITTRLVSQGPLRICFSALSSAGVTHMYSQAWISMWMLQILNKSSCLQNKSYSLSHLSSPLYSLLPFQIL